MARIRTIKPEFPQSESMGNVSRDARLLFVLLWTVVDDSGVTRGNSRMLASLLFPYDDDAPALIEGWMEELEREGCIVRYKSEGGSYLQICNWLNHQKIDKPTPSKLPQFESSRESSRILPVGEEGKGEDRKGIGEEGKGVDLPPHSDDKTPPASPSAKGTQLPADWVLPNQWGQWALQERPDLTADDVRKMAETFKDHWIANANRREGKKADWFATWRNWVRGQKAPAQGFKTAAEQRASNMERAAAEFVGEQGGNVIEGEFRNA